jgi:hypothetical protein
MGKIGYFVNWWAIIWTVFVSIIFIFPAYKPVTKDNMNWAIVFLAAIFGASAIWWYAGGRSYYTGPLIEAEAQSLNSDDSSDMRRAEKRKDMLDDETIRQRAI